MTAFLLIFEPTKDIEVMSKLNREGTSWLHIWPGAVIVHFDTTTKSLYEWLIQHHPQTRFIVTQLDLATTTWGWMPKNVWDFIQNPKPP